MIPLPAVYVETNWLLACLFPHDRRHKPARALLDEAQKGTCELRVPLIAFIEANGTMNGTSLDFAKELTQLTQKLQNVLDTGWPRFNIDQTIDGLKLMQSAYFMRDLSNELNTLKTNPHIHQFADPTNEIAAIGKIGQDLRLFTKDMKDLYILASIVVDRTKQSSQRPAIFMSDNINEFDPKKTKVPQRFYDQHRLVYYRDFDQLSTAVGKWRSVFGTI